MVRKNAKQKQALQLKKTAAAAKKEVAAKQRPLIEINSSHLSTMCGPFNLPANHKLDQKRQHYATDDEQILKPLYGTFIKTKTHLGSAQEANKLKLLVSLMATMDVINGITPPGTTRDLGDSDFDDDEGEEEEENTDGAIELPQVTIVDNTFLQKEQLSSTGLDDPLPEYIVQSLASFFN